MTSPRRQQTSFLLDSPRKRALAAALVIMGLLGSGARRAVAGIGREPPSLSVRPSVEPPAPRDPDAFMHSMQKAPVILPSVPLTRRDAVVMELWTHSKTLSRDQVVATAAALCDEAQRLHYDPLFFLAVICVESHFNHLAVSEVGAQGLMQIMPQTAAFLAEREHLPHVIGQSFDPVFNVRLGTRYLAQLDRRFHYHIERSLTAYNRGPAATAAILAVHKTLPTSVRKPYAGRVMAQYDLFLRHYGHLAVQ